MGDIRISYTYAGRAGEGREDTVSLGLIPIPPYLHSPMSQVSMVARQSPGPILTPYTTSDGYRVLFLYQEQLSMDVRHLFMSIIVQ